MIYTLALSEKRKLQRANQLLLQAPRAHETRKIGLHDFIYILQGEWELSIGKEIYRMKKDDALLLPAGITHRGGRPCAPNTEIIYLHIYPIEGDGDSVASSDNDCITINNFLHTEDHPQIKLLFQKLVEVKDNPTLSLAYVNVLFYELSKISSYRTDANLAKQLRDYLVNSKKEPSNREVAAHFHISLRTAEKIFCKEYGTPMHQYLIKHKLEQVEHYLSDFPNTPLYELAQMLNFCDEHHLSRAFKKAFGVSPREYKKKHFDNK